MYKFLSIIITILFFTHVNAQSNQNIHFDGSDDYVRVANASSLIANDNSISMSGWFNPDQFQYGAGMMGFRGEGSGTGTFYVLQLNDGRVEFRLQTANGTFDVPNTTGTLVANEWQHIAFVYGNNRVEAFVNGISVGSANASGTITSVDRPFAIGKNLIASFNFVYPGRADEVALWSKALSQQEIQDMMANELVGDEDGLELYFKCDQGFPNDDNTSIKSLTNQLGNAEFDAEILNMALEGNSSNFGGSLNTGLQAISFPQLKTKTTESAAFDLSAKSTSGLDVEFSVVSGPATVSGNTLSLTGQSGFVTIQASQPGNTSFDAAPTIESTFQVIDPNVEVSNIDIRNPVSGSLFASSLDPIELAAIIDIEFEDVLSVAKVEFFVDGERVGIKDWGNKHYTGWWQPEAYGNYTFEIVATNNLGGIARESVNFNLEQNPSDITVQAFTDAWVYNSVSSVVKTGTLPSYLGAYNEIIATLDIVCPDGGCDPWDRVSSVEAKGHNGEWYQIIRYLTPYGVACNHEIDLTDFMSILQGKIDFRVSLGTQGNGFEYNLSLEYKAGTPTEKYASIQKLWNQTYEFGDFSDLQPCEDYSINFEENTTAATIKLVSTGHGWDPAFNTGNAAEFHEDTHHIWVDGGETFTQHNWLDCNPNPDNCSPQLGTWQFNRAGWCPGSIAPWYTFDMSPYVANGSAELNYIFDEAYVDLCHPNHPDCVTGVTCSNCDQGFNPHLIVSSYLVSKSNEPYNTDTTYRSVLSVHDVSNTTKSFNAYPNPSVGKFKVDFTDFENQEVRINVLTYTGTVIESMTRKISEKTLAFDLSSYSKGVYILQVKTDTDTYNRKLIIE